MRHWLEVSQTDQARDRLASIGENWSGADSFLQVLETNELPPFEELERYLTPTGGYMIDTNTGLHFMGFDLRKAPPE